MTGGKLTYLLADLASLPNAAVVVEDRYSAVFKLDHVRPAVVADGLGEAAARFPAVPIVFAETRPLAQEWTYRFLGAAIAHHDDDRHVAATRRRPPVGWTGPGASDDHGRRARLGAPEPHGGHRIAAVSTPMSGPPTGRPIVGDLIALSCRRGGAVVATVACSGRSLLTPIG